MKNFKNLFFSVFTVLLLAVVGVTGVFAATNFYINNSGKVTYTAEPIGIKLLATEEYDDNGNSTVSYLSLSGFGSGCDSSVSSSVYTVVDSYSNSTITANFFSPASSDNYDLVELTFCIKNYGDRSFIPNVNVVDLSPAMDVTTVKRLFDSVDPIGAFKTASTTASSFNSSIESEITGNNYSSWTDGSVLTRNQTLVVKIFITFTEEISNVSDGGTGFKLNPSVFSVSFTFADPEA